MSLISGVVNNYVIPAALSRSVVIGAGSIVAIPALELIKRISEDYSLSQRYNIPAINESESAKSIRLQKKEHLNNTMLARGIGAAFLGACALNIFPGSGAVGLLGYLTYSRFSWKNEISNANPCYSLVVPGLVLQILSACKTQIAKAIISRVKIVVLAVGSFFYKIAMKINHVSLAILHVIRSLIVTPLKKLGNLLKIFKPFIRHPKLGLAFLAVLIGLVGCIKYGHHLTGAAAVVAKTLNGVVGVLLTAGTFIGQGIGKTIRPLATAISYTPMVVAKTVSGIKAVVYFFFHPLQLMGVKKV